MKNKTNRIEVGYLLTCLVAIERTGAHQPRLCELTGLSRATMQRLLNTAREDLGVVIEYVRNEGGLGGTNRITDWGVLDRRRVLQMYRADRP